MTRKLVSTVHMRDAEGAVFVFGPDSDLPSWAVKSLDDAAKDAGIDRHPAFAVEDDEPKKPRGRKAD